MQTLALQFSFKLNYKYIYFLRVISTVVCKSSIYTRGIFRDTRIFKIYFKGFGPDVTLSVRYGPNHGLGLITTELPNVIISDNMFLMIFTCFCLLHCISKCTKK